MVNSLREIDFSHPIGHYTCNPPPPLEKIMGAPLYAGTISGQKGSTLDVRGPVPVAWTNSRSGSVYCRLERRS